MTSRARSGLFSGLALLAVLTAAAVLAAPAGAESAAKATAAPKGTLLIAPDVQQEMPPVTARKAYRIANRTPQVRSERARHPDLRAEMVLYKGSNNWGISFKSGRDKLADVTVDGRTARVVEAWQGVQAGWVMARGHDGYFGERFDSWYVWLPLCLLFVAPFFDPRRPFRMLHLDLLVLVGGFGVSHFFFNKGEIGTSVPLVYPVLAYLLVRMLVAGFRPRRTGERLIPFAPAAFFVVAILLLVGFRAGLDLADGKVGDVGYGSVAGAWRIQHAKPLYVDSGLQDQHFDTYGPVNYLAYYPFVKAKSPSLEDMTEPTTYDMPAARAATLAFDLFTVVGLFLLGGRLRRGREGRLLGLALAYGWVAYPYTLFPLMSNTNDTLVSMLVVFALLAISSPPARGALTALAAAAKFAPLALAPLFASGRGLLARESRTRSWMLFSAAFAVVAVALVLPFIPAKGGFDTFWSQTVGFQFSRESPFSIWGQNPGLDGLLTIAKLGAVALAVMVAFVPRQRTTAQVAALGAAVLIASQIIAIHWFYLYIDWFAPFALVALFCEYRTAHGREKRPEPPVVEITPTPLERQRERELAGVA
jgi:glycosyl transferase family 87